MGQNNLDATKSKLEVKRAKVMKQLSGIGKKAKGSEDNFNASFPEYGQAAEDNATEIADYTTNLSRSNFKFGQVWPSKSIYRFI